MIRRWLQRAWPRRSPAAGHDEQARRIAAVFAGEPGGGDERALLAAVLEALPAGSPVEPATRAALMNGLRHCLERTDDAGLGTHLAFWDLLTARFTEDAELRWLRGYMCYLAERDDDAMRHFLAAYELAPELVALTDDRSDLLDEAALATVSPPALRLAWDLALLRGLLTVEGEAAREVYSELLDRWADDAAALARLRPLGVELAALEDAGRLPRALVRRGRGRPPVP